MKLHRIEIKNLASLADDHVLDLDRDLAGASIFLIHGPTGAGKSTLMDAVSLALFGSTPRLQAVRAAEDIADALLSRGAGEGRVAVEFSTLTGSTRRWLRATWSTWRARQRPDGKIQQVKRGLAEPGPDGSWVTLVEDHRGKVVQPHFDEALQGFTLDDFRRSMMLAQGQFDAFLRASVGERASILERLTDTSDYARLGRRAAELGQAWRARLGALRAACDAAGGVDAASEQAAREALPGLEAEVAAAAEVLRELDAAVAWSAEGARLAEAADLAAQRRARAEAAVAEAGEALAALAAHEALAELFGALDTAVAARAAADDLRRRAQEATDEASRAEALRGEAQAVATLRRAEVAALGGALATLRAPAEGLRAAEVLAASALREQQAALAASASAASSASAAKAARERYDLAVAAASARREAAQASLDTNPVDAALHGAAGDVDMAAQTWRARRDEAEQRAREVDDAARAWTAAQASLDADRDALATRQSTALVAPAAAVERAKVALEAAIAAAWALPAVGAAVGEGDGAVGGDGSAGEGVAAGGLAGAAGLVDGSAGVGTAAAGVGSGVEGAGTVGARAAEVAAGDGAADVGVRAEVASARARGVERAASERATAVGAAERAVVALDEADARQREADVAAQSARALHDERVAAAGQAAAASEVAGATERTLVENLAALRLRVELAVHRSALRDGAPCPLCGAAEHPVVADAALAARDAGERDVFQAQEALVSEAVARARQAAEGASATAALVSAAWAAAVAAEERASARQRELEEVAERASTAVVAAGLEVGPAVGGQGPGVSAAALALEAAAWRQRAAEARAAQDAVASAVQTHRAAEDALRRTSDALAGEANRLEAQAARVAAQGEALAGSVAESTARGERAAEAALALRAVVAAWLVPNGDAPEAWVDEVHQRAAAHARRVEAVAQAEVARGEAVVAQQRAADAEAGAAAHLGAATVEATRRGEAAAEAEAQVAQARAEGAAAWAAAREAWRDQLAAAREALVGSGAGWVEALASERDGEGAGSAPDDAWRAGRDGDSAGSAVIAAWRAARDGLAAAPAEVDLGWVERRLGVAERAEVGARANEAAALGSAESARGRVAALGEELARAQQRAHEANAALEAGIAAASLADVAALVARRLPPAAVAALGARRSALGLEVERAVAAEASQRDAVVAHADRRPPRAGEPDALQAARAEVTEARADAEARRDAARLVLMEAESARERRGRADAALASAEVAASVWLRLHELIGRGDGAAFRQFAQALNLGAVLVRANAHLRQLSDRYRLVPRRDPDGQPTLDLLVLDGWQVGEPRELRTLSGGEAFLVSLALALGLSDLRTVRLPLETLLLDEGFGTLDADTLDVALAALQQLQATGRQVGVISHVSALQERIAARVVVVPIGGGRSVVRVAGR